MFPHSVREPAHNNGCGPLKKNFGHPCLGYLHADIIGLSQLYLTL